MRRVLGWLLIASAGMLLVSCSAPEPTLASTRVPDPTPTATPPSLPLPSSDLLSRSARLIVTDDSLWAGHPASRTVTRLSLPDGQRLWQTEIGCEAATLARTAPRLYVACFDSGEVVVLDSATGELLGRKWVGHGPFGLLGGAGHLYVTLAHENAVIVLGTASLEEAARAATGAGPRGLGLKEDRLYVTHLLDASVRVYDARTLEPAASIRTGLQAAMSESITLSPGRERAYLPHQRQNVTNMARLFDSTVFPVVSVLNTQEMGRVRVESLALDAVDTPVSMPAAAVLGPGETHLYVANAISDDLSVVDLATNLGIGHVIVGQHPRDIALSPDGARLYTLNLVSDDVTVVDIATMAVSATLPLADDPRSEVVQEGERLFLGSRPETISRDNWMSCASCHVDGGSDGQTWLGTTGGPRNTTILRGIGDTEPLHWSADRADVQAFDETLTGLMAGTGLSDSELDTLAAYLNGLQPISSPLREAGGALTEEAVRGAGLFREAGCAVCHAPPRFTDRRLHDVGTGEPFHAQPAGAGLVPETMGSAYDTPSLRELWHTAPYLHDGRAATLRDVLTTFNTGDAHGRTSGLSEDELAALEAFLLSLPLKQSELAEYFGD